MNEKKRGVSPAFRSMATMAFYLVLLIGMWAVISYVVFPDGGEKDTYANFVARNEPLLAQIGENVIDPEKHAGILQTPEVQAVIQEGGFSALRAENGCALFVIPTENLSPDLTTALVFCPDGEYALPEGIVWNVVVSEGKSERYEDSGNAGRYVALQQLSDRFYLAEVCMPA